MLCVLSPSFKPVFHQIRSPIRLERLHVASDAELTNRQILFLFNLMKRFDVAVRLFSNRSPI